MSFPGSDRFRLALVIACALLSLALIAGAFWEADARYSLPTARPANYAPPMPGDLIKLPHAIPARDANRPLALVFLNPDCPCSRFTTPHVAELIARFAGVVSFVLVAEAADEPSKHSTFHSIGLNAETICDADRAIARSCGVYSTPQFVLIDSRGALFFRGNFNLSRYCSEERAQFARIAIESLCAGTRLPDFPPAATTAYGCEVPRVNGGSGGSP